MRKILTRLNISTLNLNLSRFVDKNAFLRLHFKHPASSEICVKFYNFTLVGCFLFLNTYKFFNIVFICVCCAYIGND